MSRSLPASTDSRSSVLTLIPALGVAVLMIVAGCTRARAQSWSPPEVPPWQPVPSSRALVYVVPPTSREEAGRLGARIDGLLEAIEREAGLTLSGALVYPLYPSAERFRDEWWRFAVLRDGVVHGWGTIADAAGRGSGGREPWPGLPYQIARVVALQNLGAAIPLLTWGLGDLLADRLVGTDPHAHARLFLDRGGLPPLEAIVHQVDFSRALPGSHSQSVSLLAFLAELRGLPAVVALARDVRGRWYDFGPVFERHFHMTPREADRRWRERLAGVKAPSLNEAEFAAYLRAEVFAAQQTLARTPGGLVMRPGGADAYVGALRATEALRQFDLPGAVRAHQDGARALEAASRRARVSRQAITIALWAVAIVPIVLAVALLAMPPLREAWARRRTRRARKA